VHPVDLGAAAWRGLFERVDVDPGAVDDVIAGCVDAIGPQAGNIARLSWLAADIRGGAGVTVDRQCGSQQQAVSFGAQAILSGSAELILAGGVQNMSQIPISSAMIVGEQFGFTSPSNESKSWLHRYGDQEISQFRGAELIAESGTSRARRWKQYALTSHQRAQAAIRADTSRTRSSPVDGFVPTRARATPSLEKMAGLKTLGRRWSAHRRDGEPDLRWSQRGCCSHRKQAVKDHGLKPRARIPPHQRPRRRSGVHVDRPDSRDALRVGEDRSGRRMTSTPSRFNEAFAPRSCMALG
jgi:acetyl-CoA C-acetyltransferase